MKTVGDGTRALNFLIDTLLFFLLSLMAWKGWNFYVLYWEYPPFNFGWFFFGTGFLYYFLFESLFAKTPAKWITACKLVDLHGNKPRLFAVLIRTLSRLILIDLFFLPFLGKTLHDYLSKTSLIED